MLARLSDWLKAHHADLADPNGFAPRRLYGLYIRARLDAVEAAHPGLIQRVRGEAVAVEGQSVALSDGRRITGRAVVLATGNPEPAATTSDRGGRVISNPWAQGALDGIGPDDAVLIVGTAGTAGMIRRLRANLLDELQKQYVVTARAKGLHPFKALIKYPLRMSLNFFISDIGDILPSIVSGAEVVAIVLSLQTTGPLLIRALQSQDMYLAGSFLMFLSFLTVIGVLISDIALAILDPRIRLQGDATK